jgi:hypothetical protein
MVYSLIAALFGIVLLFLLYEKRNNYHYTTVVRGIVGDLIYRFRSRRNNKQKELR